MIVNIDLGMKAAREMLDFSDKISKKRFLTRAGINEATAQLATGAAQISSLAAAILALARQQQEVKSRVPGSGEPQERERDFPAGEEPKGHPAEDRKAGPGQ